MGDTLFETIEAEFASGGAEAALERLGERLRAEKRFHDLFDARLMLARHRFDLPPAGGASIDDLPEPARSRMEEASLAACREVGELLAAEGKLREAWMYLRPAGEKAALAAALERTEIDDENLDEVVELALRENLAPAYGFQVVLDHYGTCNAITTFESIVSQLPQAAQVAAAELLVEHLYDELLTNVRSHVEDRRPGEAAGKSLGELAAGQPWIFENDSYHTDTSHLSSTVRYARLIDREAPLRKALELTEYGRRLSGQYQYPGEEPFVDHYPAHGLLFAATLGERVDEALAHFRDRAEAVDAHQEGTAALETYLILLARLGRHGEALEETARLAPAGVPFSPYAPKPLDLAKQSGAMDRYLEICRERNDVLGFAAGLVGGRA
jgi:hypothetical protein